MAFFLYLLDVSDSAFCPVLHVATKSQGRRNYRKRLASVWLFMRLLLSLCKMGSVIHAASVGEVIAATPLVKRIQKDYPHLPITFYNGYTNRF